MRAIADEPVQTWLAIDATLFVEAVPPPALFKSPCNICCKPAAPAVLRPALGRVELLPIHLFVSR